MELEICNEMKKLRDWLTKNDVAWHDESSISRYYWMARTKFYVGEHYFSVINGMGSYGGYRWGFKNQGLLECMVDNSEPEGWLTAEDVEERIKSIWETEKKENANTTVTS